MCCLQDEITDYLSEAAISVPGNRLGEVIGLIRNIEGGAHNRTIAQRHNVKAKTPYRLALLEVVGSRGIAIEVSGKRASPKSGARSTPLRHHPNYLATMCIAGSSDAALSRHEHSAVFDPRESGGIR
jgi:hypothetical protein